MKRLFATLLLATAALVGGKAVSQTIIDTALPEKLFQLGVRVGFNTSNLTNNYDKLASGAEWTDNKWRSGFTAGVVFDINLRNFFAIQPGAFIQTRSNDYHLLFAEGGQLRAVNGRQSANYLQVPILASLRLGVPQLAQVHIDLGPYFAWGWGGDHKYRVYDSSTGEMGAKKYKDSYFGDSNDALCKRYDYGVKTGVGLMVMQHYYIGVHYQYGCRNAMQQDGHKGHNKMWTITVGYNL